MLILDKYVSDINLDKIKIPFANFTYNELIKNRLKAKQKEKFLSEWTWIPNYEDTENEVRVQTLPDSVLESLQQRLDYQNYSPISKTQIVHEIQNYSPIPKTQTLNDISSKTDTFPVVSNQDISITENESPKILNQGTSQQLKNSPIKSLSESPLEVESEWPEGWPRNSAGSPLLFDSPYIEDNDFNDYEIRSTYEEYKQFQNRQKNYSEIYDFFDPFEISYDSLVTNILVKKAIDLGIGHFFIYKKFSDSVMLKLDVRIHIMRKISILRELCQKDPDKKVLDIIERNFNKTDANIFCKFFEKEIILEPEIDAQTSDRESLYKRKSDNCNTNPDKVRKKLFAEEIKLEKFQKIHSKQTLSM